MSNDNMEKILISFKCLIRTLVIFPNVTLAES